MSMSKIATDALKGTPCYFLDPQQEVTRAEYMKHYFKEREDVSSLHECLKSTTYNCKNVKCFIFDHKYFDPDMGLSVRTGTECDRYGLDETFRRMKITPVIHIDSTKDFIFEVLENFAADLNDKCDCLIVCILTHGDDKDGLSAYDCSYPLETLMEIFYGNNCRKLVGKPKLFIANACQGDDRDLGALPEISTDIVAPRSLPVTSDILIALSTFPKYVSWRQFNGTWFIQCLVTVLNENLTNEHKMDIESLLRIVKDRVAINNSDETDDLPKQQPVTISTLRKKLYL